MPLDPNRWTQKTQEAVATAHDLARQRHHAEVPPEHLLAALLSQEDGVVLPTLTKAGVAVPALRTRTETALSKLAQAYGGGEARLSRETRDAMDAADRERSQFGDEYLSTEHILLALTAQVGVSREDLLAVLRDVRGSHRVTSQNPEQSYQALERYGRDLTDAARDGKLDPVIGRDEEIRRVIQVLSRRTKNNPVLIG